MGKSNDRYLCHIWYSIVYFVLFEYGQSIGQHISMALPQTPRMQPGSRCIDTKSKENHCAIVDLRLGDGRLHFAWFSYVLLFGAMGFQECRLLLRDQLV